jgi:hypothetical protein
MLKDIINDLNHDDSLKEITDSENEEEEKSPKIEKRVHYDDLCPYL